MYTARTIVDHARSIADLQETKFISYDDEVNFLNESYKDLYNRYTESSGDYWVIESVLTVSIANQAPNSNGWGWLIDLPADFYKLRSVSWGSGGQWFPAQSFSLSQRDYSPTTPVYRLRNNQLWVLSITQPQIKIEYYPPPETITLPGETLDFCSTLTEFQRLSVIYPYYLSEQQSMLYVSGNDIKIESLLTNTTLVLFTSVNAKTYVTYYKGYIYWIESGNIYRASTDYVSTLVPGAAIVSGGANTRLWIFRDKIYYTNASATLSANLDGTGSATYQSAVLNYLCPLRNTSIAYLDNSNNLFVDGVAVTGFSYIGLSSDTVYLYGQSSFGVLTRLTLSAANLITAQDQIATDISYIGTAINDDYLPIKSIENINIQALSIILDFAFDYPTNEVYEIMSYSSALKYLSKNTDTEKYTIVKSQLDDADTGLWKRFLNVNARDEYQVYRINNDYNSPSRWPYGAY